MARETVGALRSLPSRMHAMQHLGRCASWWAPHAAASTGKWEEWHLTESPQERLQTAPQEPTSTLGNDARDVNDAPGSEKPVDKIDTLQPFTLRPSRYVLRRDSFRRPHAVGCDRHNGERMLVGPSRKRAPSRLRCM